MKVVGLVGVLESNATMKTSNISF